MMASVSRGYRGVASLLARYALLVTVLALSIVPMLWMVSTALKGPGDNIFSLPPRFWPAEPTLRNFTLVFQTIPMWRYYFNSLVVVAATVTLTLVLSITAAFPLARMRFRGKQLLFFATLSTLMIPIQLTMIPNFIFVVQIGLRNSLWGVILPNAVTAFGIFLIRQSMLTVPRALEEAAIVDGCGSLRVLFNVMLPMVKPALAALAIFTFVNMWGDFLWPLLVLDDANLLTVPLGVQRLQGTFTTDWRLISAGSILAMIPILLFFVINQRHFIDGAITSAVKG